MHQNRKKKKRVNYGVRAVEVLRGMKGFGFTISGQQPCILSCIVPGSPADIAGLRAGDYLVSVNGHNVSKLPHDDVVQLIGRSKGILRLQIAENYYSDSSDEEGVTTVRCKPKYIHKPRASNMGALQLQCRVAKVVRDLQSGAMFDAAGKTPPEVQSHGTYCDLHYHWDMSSPLPPPPPPASHKRDSEKIVHRTVVGYLGTIDIPNQLHPSCMMQVLRKCIKRLKAEKRNPTTVLLTIHVANIKLTNSENRIIAEYPSYRIIFCNSFSEQDKQYFGILTKSVKDKENIVSNSCHVFTIYYKLIDHTVHSSVCNIFGFTCTKTSELNVCQEFPDSCNGLIGAIQTLYISDSTASDTNPYNEMRRHQETASPQPSNISTSTAHSSNSDSGIGYKDDSTSRSDKNIVQNVSRRCPTSEYRDACEYSTRAYGNEAVDLRLTVRAVSSTCWNEANKSDIYKDNTELPRESVVFNDFCNGISMCTEAIDISEMNSGAQKGTKRGDLPTCPLPSASTVKQGLVSSSVGSLVSVCTTAMLHGIEDHIEASDDSIIKSKRLLGFTRLAESAEIDPRDKFSPKVFSGISKSLVHSFEDLNTSMDYARPLCQTYSDKSDNSRPWGSLQEIRNIGTCAQDSCLHGSTELCDKNTDCNDIHAWATGFEKLLEDPKGLQTFAEFLKKEFSHENIYFWAACERYKDTKDVTARRKLANQIYQRHLSTTAAEPVNVDSHATGQITQELLSEAPADLFLQAQKQVFNLMKFDSYPRFLRSDLYRRCVETGSSIIGAEDCDLNLTSSPSVKLKKSHSDAEDRCRKSILPWNRKNRSKSKDRGESEYNKGPNRNETIYKSFTTIKREAEGNNNDDSISISSSRSSLASWDLALRQSFHKHSLSSYEGQSNETKDVRAKCTGLCRVILPDGSTTVVPTSETESIKDVVTRLLDKRALRYSNYDVLILATDETIEPKFPSSALAGQEVEVVPTKILKVDLPTRRVITVIAHKGRTLKEVLRPLLNKYGFNLDMIIVWSENHRVCMDIQAIDAPTRLILTTIKDEVVLDPQKELNTVKCTHDVSNSQPTLDEITNRVFEELLVGKGSNKYYNDGSCKSDDQRSEGSSILPSKFFLRDSTMHGKKKGGKSKCNMNERSNANDYVSDETAKSHPPLIAKWRNGVKLQLPGKYDGEDLYEGLKRAQRSRLEDQRGTEINFELPDFLKNKENGKPTDRNKVRRPRIISAYCEANSKFYGSINERQNCSGQDQNTTTITTTPTTQMISLKNGNVDERFHISAIGKESQSKSPDSSFMLDTTLTDGDRTVVENGSCSRTIAMGSFDTQANSSGIIKSSKPPPLPPKPKNLVTSATKTGYIVSSKSLPKSNHAVPLNPTESTRKNIF
ncbi:unnamed protein product [Xylocopa violacea]|uniref:Regulator of G-protein signaling loco n=1 Tax=Xylocopa violacea TaxID=135666 RepID=A0ABP1NEC0_XYLVO